MYYSLHGQKKTSSKMHCNNESKIVVKSYVMPCIHIGKGKLLVYLNKNIANAKFRVPNQSPLHILLQLHRKV